MMLGHVLSLVCSMAVKNRMDLAVSISVGSAIQVALPVAPLLVLLGVVL